MGLTITWDRPERAQASNFGNATLDTFAPGVAISAAVHVACPVDVDPTDRAAVEAWLHRVFDPLEDLGCGVEIQLGPDCDSEDE